jgi:hypothetical protein
MIKFFESLNKTNTFNIEETYLFIYLTNSDFKGIRFKLIG